MAFAFGATLPHMEYRGKRSGSTDRGRWLSLVFEDSEARQLEVSVRKDMQDDVLSLGLSKGDVCAISIFASARADGNSYVQLTALPELADSEGAGF